MSDPVRPEDHSRGTQGDAPVAIALAILAVALYVRTLAYPALEVSDAAVAEATNAGQALDAGGLGGLVLHVLGLGTTALPARALALALHAAATALAFLLGRRLGLAPAAGALVALLFAAHPLRVEALAWLSRIGTLLGATAFLLGSVLALGDDRRRRRAGTAALALAFLADPRLLGGLAWLVLVERRVLRRKKARAELAVDLAPPAAAGWIALGGLDSAREPVVGTLAALAHAPLALASLLGEWMLPLASTPHHPHPALAGGAFLPAAAGWLALGLALALLLRRTRRALGLPELGGLLFLCAGALHALPQGSVLYRDADAYLPALGLELALAGLLAPLLARVARPSAAGAAAGLVALAVLAQRRVEAWRSEETLQRASLDVADTAAARVALGRWHVLHGRHGRAQAEYERALALEPHHDEARFQLGVLEIRRGLVPGQEPHLLRAVEMLRLAHPRAPLRLGEAYQRLGQDALARAALLRAVERLPRDATAHVRLGMAELALGNAAEARAAFERATELDGDAPEAWCGLGIARFQADELDAAAAALGRALALEPDHPESNATLGRVLELRGAHAEAEAHYRRAVAVNPDSVDALFALGMRLAGSGRGDEAVRLLERVVALRTDPPHVRASLALALLHLERGDDEPARALAQRVLAYNPAHAEARALLARLDADRER